MKSTIQAQVAGNLHRVRNLIQIYEGHLMGSGSGRRGHMKTDVLRSAIVFLHATMEDFLRSIAYWKIPSASRDVIDSIPLVGSRCSAKKFWLGELVQHKGKSVDGLICESVTKYLERSNYNNTKEVMALLESISINVAMVNGRFPDLEELMQRRHQIVHQADQDKRGGHGNFRVRSIGRATLQRWLDAVASFSHDVLAQL